MPNPKKFIANDLDALKSLLTDFRGHKFAKSDNGNQQRIMPTKSYVKITSKKFQRNIYKVILLLGICLDWILAFAYQTHVQKKK